MRVGLWFLEFRGYVDSFHSWPQEALPGLQVFNFLFMDPTRLVQSSCCFLRGTPVPWITTSTAAALGSSSAAQALSVPNPVGTPDPWLKPLKSPSLLPGCLLLLSTAFFHSSRLSSQARAS